MADDKKTEAPEKFVDTKTDEKVRPVGYTFTPEGPEAFRKPFDINEVLAKKEEDANLPGAGEEAPHETGLRGETADEIAGELLRHRQLGFTAGAGSIPDVLTNIQEGIDTAHAAHEAHDPVPVFDTKAMVESADTVIEGQVHDGLWTDNEMAKLDAAQAVQPDVTSVVPHVPPGDLPKDGEGNLLDPGGDNSVVPVIEAEAETAERSHTLETETADAVVDGGQELTPNTDLPHDATDPSSPIPEPERQDVEPEGDVLPIPEVPELQEVPEPELPEPEPVEPPVVDEDVPASATPPPPSQGGVPIKSKTQAIREAVAAKKKEKK